MKESISIEAINLRTKKVNGFKILTVFSKEYGLIKLSGSKLGGRSEPFVHNRYWINFGSNDIHSIKQTEFIDHFRNLSTDLDKLYLAWQFAEFIEACSHFHEERSEQIFDLLFECLDQLERNNDVNNVELVNYFLWKLTEFLGYKPNLSMCERTKCSLLEGELVDSWFSFQQGGVSCSACSNKPTSDFVTILPGIYKQLNYLSSIDEFQSQESISDNALNFVRTLLQRYLQTHTDRKIKSINGI
ncbi:MAG: DNA repair protein RecO [Candidatus Caenarcaniphilales bacterium]|nr:DNA repair protein RecO [Candidatus Caenarcaniphilales bacterium]